MTAMEMKFEKKLKDEMVTWGATVLEDQQKCAELVQDVKSQIKTPNLDFLRNLENTIFRLRKTKRL